MSDIAAAIKNLTTEEVFRVRSKAMALVLLDQCYDLVTDQELLAPFSAKHDFLKTVTKFAGLEPKEDIAAAGARFSIKVVYSGSPERTPGGVTIEGGVVLDGVVGFSDNPPTYLTPSFTTDQLAGLSAPEEE